MLDTYFFPSIKFKIMPIASENLWQCKLVINPHFNHGKCSVLEPRKDKYWNTYESASGNTFIIHKLDRITKDFVKSPHYLYNHDANPQLYLCHILNNKMKEFWIINRIILSSISSVEKAYRYCRQQHIIPFDRFLSTCRKRN